MHAVALVLRGIRWRAWASLAVLFVAVVATAAAVAAPMYAHSAEESLIRDRLGAENPVSTGYLVRGQLAGQTQFSASDVMQAVRAASLDSRLDAWYGRPTLGVSVTDAQIAVGSHALGVAEVGWHDGMCTGGVVVLRGRCPTSGREAMVSAGLADSAHLAVGSQLDLGIYRPDGNRVRVVGVYDAATAKPSVWGPSTPAQAVPGVRPGDPDRLDEILVPQDEILGSAGQVAAASLRPLLADRLTVDALPDAVAAVAAASGTMDPQGAVHVSRVSTLAEAVDQLAPDRSQVRTAAFAVTAQLVLLAWAVLFLIVSATADERSGEVALAKLRGMRTRATMLFGLGESVLLLLAAIPLGLAVGWLAAAALVSAYLLPGIAVTMTPGVWLALGVSFLGGLSAAALAARGILRAPVLEELRRTSGRRAQLARSVAVDAAAVALAAAGLYELRQGRSDLVAVLAPGLLALALGLLVVRVVPFLARAAERRTRASSGIASFLTARNIARRPKSLQLVVLVAVAVGLAVFAVDSWVLAAQHRTANAEAQVGASTVLTVSGSSPDALRAAVDAVDPDGRWAMAALSTSAQGGGLLAVDTPRLAAVTAWDPAWAGTTFEHLSAALRPPASASVPVTGRLAVSADRSGSAAPLDLVVRVRDAAGHPSDVLLGRLAGGRQRLTAELPQCLDGCTIVSFDFIHPVGLPGQPVDGSVVLSGAEDARGAVDLTAQGVEWRSGVWDSTGTLPATGTTVATSGAGLTVTMKLSATQDAAAAVADHPDVLPVVLGDRTQQTTAGDSSGALLGVGVSGDTDRWQPVAQGLLPRLGRDGAMADLGYALAERGPTLTPAEQQVWLGAAAPSDAAQRLTAAGVSVTRTESLADRIAVLDRDGTALALRLFLVSAATALVLAAGTLLASAYVAARRRSYELAALRTLGASHGVLVRAGRREQLALGAVGALVGTLAGATAATLALPALDRLSGSGDGPSLGYAPAWGALAVLLVVTMVVLAVLADLGARRAVHLAVPDRLREVQA